jgi:hypothetical protein
MAVPGHAAAALAQIDHFTYLFMPCYSTRTCQPDFFCHIERVRPAPTVAATVVYRQHFAAGRGHQAFRHHDQCLSVQAMALCTECRPEICQDCSRRYSEDGTSGHASPRPRRVDQIPKPLPSYSTGSMHSTYTIYICCALCDESYRFWAHLVVTGLQVALRLHVQGDGISQTIC